MFGSVEQAPGKQGKNYLYTTRVKVIVYFVTISFIIFCIFNTAFYTMYSENTKKVVINEVSGNVAQTTEYVDLVMKNVENMSEAILTNPLIQQQMVMEQWDTPDSLMNIRDSVTFMQALLQSITGAASISIYLQKPEILLNSDMGLVSSLDDKIKSEYINVQEAYDRQKWVDLNRIKPSIAPQKDGEYITLVRPLYTTFSQTKAGVLFINLDRKMFSNYLGILGNSANLILNEENNIITDSVDKVLLSFISSNAILDPVKNSSSGHFVKKFQGKEFAVVYNTSRQTGWKFVSINSLQESVDRVTKIKDYILLFLSANFILVMIITFLLSRKMFRPVKKLVTFMKKVEDGDFHVEIEEERNDEFGYLFRNFNKMVGRIRYLFQELFQQKLLKKDAELKLMQSQINPHFLHNIFNNMSWLLELKRYEDLEEMIDSVASYYKTSLNLGNNFILVSDNVEQLKSYASIQRIRFKNKFTCEFAFEDAILNVRIPNLILQPLLENAICHGVEPCERFCSIQVIGKIEGERIVFSVEDDGVGIQEETLKEIVLSLQEDKAVRDKNFALANVNQRIKLYYGEAYALSLSSVKNEKTIVRVSIPLHGERMGGQG